MFFRDLDQYEDLFDKIDEQKSAQDQINQFIKEKAQMGKEEESEMMKELEELEVENALD